MLFVPHQYQTDAIERMTNDPQLALFWDPGLGKTVTSLSAVKRIKQQTLIVAPLNVVYGVWPKEIQKWDHTKSISYAILHGPNKTENIRKKVGVYIINPAGLKWLFNYCKKNKYFPFKVLIIDESTDFKNFKSKSFQQYLAPMLNAFERRYILTGTPVAKNYLDLWSQYYILDLGQRLSDNFYQYRSRFFYAADYNRFDWQPFPGANEQIREVLRDITIRISGRDHLDLPEIFFNKIELSFNAKTKSVYRTMAKELLVEFDDGLEVTAANAAVKSNKLQCITNGFLYVTEKYVENGKKKSRLIRTEEIHETKLDALSNVVSELNGNPLLVGYYYKHDLKMLLRKFPGTPYYGGDSGQAEKLKIETEWNAGKYPLLFAQVESAARGLNLQESGYNVFFYSLIWNWTSFDQFIKRVARQGQKSNRVIVHVPLTQRSIDNVIWERLQSREEQSEEFLNSFMQHLKDA